MPEIRIQLTRAGLQKLLADALAEVVAGNYDGLLADAHLGLFKDGPPFAEEHVLATMTECDYDGYARQPIVFAAPGLSPANRPAVHGGGLLFSPTGAVTPNDVKGVLLTDALAAGNLYGLGYFAAPVTFNGTEDDMTIVPIIEIPKDVFDWGKFVQII